MTTRDDALRRIVYFKELAEHPNTPADEAQRARIGQTDIGTRRALSA